MTLSGIVGAAINFGAANQALLIPGVLLVVVVASIRSFFSGGKKGKNPFHDDHTRAPEPFVHDTRLRDAVLKDRFKPAKVPDNLDAIIIGSGAGGLSAGVLLTFAGKKVLVLEQHDQAGGCCHSFVEKGFEFDTGIHYIGDVHEGGITRALLDQLTCGQLRWIRLDDNFDTVVLGKPPHAKFYPMKAGRYYENLINMFPKEKQAILKYQQLIQDAATSDSFLVTLKVLPLWVVKILIKTGLYRVLFKAYRKSYTTKSLQEVLDDLTDNKELKLVLSYIYVDLGVLPKDAPFFLHASVIQHYSGGAFYPVNGSSEIAFHMIQAIQKGGGKVLVQAPVTKIVCDSNGRALGVKVGKNEVEIHAKYIISDAGVINTFKKLLPEDVARKSIIYPLIENIGPSVSFVTAFIGIDGNTSDLNLPNGNIFFYNSHDINKLVASYLNVKADEVEQTEIPFAYISFPSAKDPEFEKKYPGKTAVLSITNSKWDWFKEWKDEKVRHRGDRYEGIKDAIGRQMWQQIVDIFPQLEGRKVYMEVGTPVSNQYYLACPNGEMYGLELNKERFSPEVVGKMRTDTDIKGLHLTGQDAMVPGFISALLISVMCVSKILNRNVYSDLVKLHNNITETSASSLKKKE